MENHAKAAPVRPCASVCRAPRVYQIQQMWQRTVIGVEGEGTSRHKTRTPQQRMVCSRDLLRVHSSAERHCCHNESVHEALPTTTTEVPSATHADISFRQTSVRGGRSAGIHVLTSSRMDAGTEANFSQHPIRRLTHGELCPSCVMSVVSQPSCL